MVVSLKKCRRAVRKPASESGSVAPVAAEREGGEFEELYKTSAAHRTDVTHRQGKRRQASWVDMEVLLREMGVGGAKEKKQDQIA